MKSNCRLYSNLKPFKQLSFNFHPSYTQEEHKWKLRKDDIALAEAMSLYHHIQMLEMKYISNL